MCGPPKDDSAEIARRQERERQARINEGTQLINQQFSQFNPEFYQGVEQSALDFYSPQLQDQFGDAREALIKRLARSGNLHASAGAELLGDLQKSLADNQSQIGSRARDLRLSTEANVNNSRQELISQLQASADPMAAAQAATNQAASLATPATLSPLVDVFASFLNSGANVVQAQRLGYPGAQFQWPGSGSGGGSSYVVN